MEWLSFQRTVWIFARWVETQIYGASKFILCIGGTTSNSFLPRFFSEAKFAACTIKCTFKWEVGRSSNVWWKIHPLQVIHSYFKCFLPSNIRHKSRHKYINSQPCKTWIIEIFVYFGSFLWRAYPLSSRDPESMGRGGTQTIAEAEARLSNGSSALDIKYHISQLIPEPQTIVGAAEASRAEKWDHYSVRPVCANDVDTGWVCTTHCTSLQKEQMFPFIIISSLLWFVSKKPFPD